MDIKVIKQDLFSIDEKYCFAHCISSDYALGAGIAKEFNKRYDMSTKLKAVGKGITPDCILIGETFNLVTKPKYFHKPTYDSLKESLILMRNIVERDEIFYLAMPKIGCGLDRLNWEKVEKIIEEVFWYTEVEILICTI